MMFNKAGVLAQFESLRQPNGVFVAAPSSDYQFFWPRDHLYATMAYWYLDDHKKLRQGIHACFDYYRAYEETLKMRIASPDDLSGTVLRSKTDPLTFGDVTPDGWPHDQLDAIGLFLHSVADYEFKNVGVLRDEKDREILQLLVYYLRSVEYWQHRDNGIWEECKIVHATSVGAVTAGLRDINRQRLAIVPEPLIHRGYDAFASIFPYESRDDCRVFGHCHDRDASQLFLIWPFHFLTIEQQNIILDRIVNGSGSEDGKPHSLVQTHGFNRYWGDNWYRSDELGKFISAEWTMDKFLRSIIHSDRHEKDLALQLFKEGHKEMVDDKVPEFYRNGEPNEHTPLAWGQALALIAFAKLPSETQKKVSE